MNNVTKVRMSMSNVKKILIQGDLDTQALMHYYAPDSVTYLETDGMVIGFARGHNIPYDKVSEALKAAKRINRLLAATTLPHFGLKVYFDKVQCRVERNGYNGQISYFRYTIEGEEAVPFPWFDALVAALEIFGKVSVRACHDMEN
jgi:hypothetical protein